MIHILQEVTRRLCPPTVGFPVTGDSNHQSALLAKHVSQQILKTVKAPMNGQSEARPWAGRLSRSPAEPMVAQPSGVGCCPSHATLAFVTSHVRRSHILPAAIHHRRSGRQSHRTSQLETTPETGTAPFLQPRERLPSALYGTT
eukprot:scaffold53060_cov29-Tisochrysis_lutea.AAC.5